jgi:hypothetical protein
VKATVSTEFTQPWRTYVPKSVTKRRTAHEIKEVHDGDVARFQISVNAERWGPAFMNVVITYLDGVTRIYGTEGKMKEERLPMAKPEIKTVADFGRISTAAQKVAAHLTRYRNVRPTPDQLGVLLLSYQGLLAQREEAQKKLTQADGEIQTVGRLLSKFVSVPA